MPDAKSIQRVPLSTVASMPRLLEAAGLDARAVAVRAGLDPAGFDDPLQTISLDAIGRYLAVCTEATRDDSISLRAGLAQGPSALTTYGFLAMNSANVRAALATLSRYVHRFAGDMTVGCEHGQALLSYSYRYPRQKNVVWIVDAGVGLAIAFLRALCGPSWSPLEIRLNRAVPSKPQEWRRNLHGPVYFGHESNLIVFSARWLDQPVERADPQLRRLLLDKVAELEAQGGGDFPSRVGATIRSSLLAGDASLPHVAGRLAISSATLKRHLRAAGVSFSALLERTRMDMACQLLANSDASIAQIGEILNYAQLSTFSRAFAQWTGMSPRAWRAQSAERHAAVGLRGVDRRH